MDARSTIKAKLPSRHVTEGPERAPHRSYYYAMGLTEAEIHQPFVGVASCWNEAAPCNIALMRQAQSTKKGVKSAGGTPREFCTITVTDGIAMGHEGMRSSLVSREVIADSVELTMRGHCYDALVGIAGCDKSLPGMMMAMLRLNVPSVFLYGGSIMPGKFHGKDVTVVDVFEAVGKHSAGTMSNAELHELECVACPGAGACGGQFTANSMAGGVRRLVRTLLDGGFIHGDCLTATGRTVAENLKSIAFNANQKVMRDVKHPLAPTGGVIGLKGNLAPDGAIVKVAGLKHVKHR